MMHSAVTTSSKTFCKRVVFDLQLSYLYKKKKHPQLVSCLPGFWRDLNMLRAVISSNIKETNYGRKCPIRVWEDCPMPVLNVQSERFQSNTSKYAHRVSNMRFFLRFFNSNHKRSLKRDKKYKLFNQHHHLQKVSFTRKCHGCRFYYASIGKY